MEALLLRALLVGVLLAALVVIGRWWQRRDGTVRAGHGAALATDHLDAVGLDLSGVSAGAVLLGSPTCTPCVAVKQVLGELEAERPGFRWVYADAADHLDLAEAHRILRVPTLLVVGQGGRILARTSGVPQADDLRRVLDEGADLQDCAA